MAGMSYNIGNSADRLKYSGKELDEEGGLYNTMELALSLSKGLERLRPGNSPLERG